MSLRIGAADGIQLLQCSVAVIASLTMLTSCWFFAGYGYIDKTGREVIRGPFEEAFRFSEGLARVKVGGKYGFIDRNGRVTIKPQFLDANDFSEGLAVVDAREDIRNLPSHRDVDKNGKLIVKLRSDFNSRGYVDRNGKLAIKPQFSIANDFSEGLAWVEIATTPNITAGWKSGYIDKTGAFVIPTDVGDDFQGHSGFDGNFRGGLAPVLKQPQGKWGYINKSGKFVIEPRFEKAFDFSEGLARVVINGHTGFIDRAGRLAVQPEYDFVDWPRRNFSDGMAAVSKHGKWGYVDNTGKEVIKPEFDESSDFTDGFAVVNVGARIHPDALIAYYGGGDTWVINKSGKKVDMGGEPLDLSSGEFSEGMLVVKRKGASGYVDKTGKMIIAPQWDCAGDFHEGLAPVHYKIR